MVKHYPTLQEDLRQRMVARSEGSHIGYGETHSLRRFLECKVDLVIRDYECLQEFGALKPDEAQELAELKALAAEARSLYQLG
jgi:hypothetical protein